MAKVKVEVLTLDAEQCAACQYMLEVLKEMPPEIQDMMEYKEYNIKTPEGVQKFVSMKGRVLPTIAINGDLVFESIIPTYDELIEAIKARA